jgi:hypothetical protein
VTEVQPHNIHHHLPDLEKGRDLRVSVVIPAYNRSAQLRKTLQALAAQRADSPEFEVHVADDGSEEDLEAVVASVPSLDIHYHRRDRDRFGAGQARNLAAASAEGDILVFLDSDCLVEPDFVLGHASWHTTGEKTVVIGGRSRAVMGSSDELADYRKRLRRRTAGLQHGNEVFRSFVTANVSLPRGLFQEVGGFDERFHRWGGEDTELGWRLWSAGAIFLDDESVSATHQIEDDPSGGSEGRRRAHQLNMGLIASLIPNRFYRKEPPDAIPEVPKVSILLHDVPPGTSHETWEELLKQPRTDFELIVVADVDPEEPLAGASAGDPRLWYTDSMGSAVDSARGEYICFLDGHGAPSRDLLTGAIRRLDRQPMMVTATVGYALPKRDGGPIRGENGARDVERSWDSAMPLCWFIRTREVVKLRDAGVAVEDLWERSQLWDSNLHWSSAAVRLPGAVRSPRPRSFTHQSARRQELATEVVTRRLSLADAARSYLRTREVAEAHVLAEPQHEPEPGRPSARYFGWSGHHNIGDEVMLESIRRLLPWVDIETSGDPGNLIILGGGTLINRSSYLRQVTERDTPRAERAVIGTGVASPDYWGQLEDPQRWVRWLGTCSYVGVRGPKSLDRLQSWGFEGELEVCGDSALLVERPDVERVPGRIVVAPAWTKGKLWGESDRVVMEAMAHAVGAWRSEGRDVVFLASSPDDDGQILQMERAMGSGLDFVQGYLDQTAAISTLASAELVVGERLHACVIAAAVSTPFVPIEYRPKLRDFSASLGKEHLVVRTDEISGPALVELASEAVTEGTEETDRRVTRYRHRLRSAARVIERAVTG